LPLSFVVVLVSAVILTLSLSKGKDPEEFHQPQAFELFQPRLSVLRVYAIDSHPPLETVPIANHDDNQHAANENLRLQNLWDGIETMAALIAMP
jgi:hypothetical protein